MSKKIANRLTWKKVSSFEWASTCGRYWVWIQSRPREDGSHHAARRGGPGPKPWLCDHGSLSEAKDACEKDLVGSREGPRRVSADP